MKKIFSKKVVIPIIAVIVVAVVISFFLPKKSNLPVVDLSETTVLEYRDIQKSISSSGIVESSDSTLVYSTLSSIVEEVSVKLGDYVEKGQLLATLDDEAIQNQITSAQINLENTQTAQKQQLQAAKETYENFLYSLENGLNANLNAAELQVDNAFEAYSSANKIYNDYLKTAPAIVSAQAALTQAEEDYKNATDDNRDDLKAALDVAKKNYNDTLKADLTAQKYSEAVEGALKGYQTAKKNLKSVENALNDQLSAYETAYKNAKANSSDEAIKESIRQLKVTLSDTKVKAPVSGTVTAVYAKEGGVGSGLLFVIEDTEKLIVDTYVKGYDVSKVKEGLAVLITSEAIKNEVFDGVITSIAPTANKNAYGTTDLTSNPIFATEVEITSTGSDLRIGMEVDLDFIIESQKNIFAVPYDAVFEKNSKSYVICAQETKDEKYLLSEIEVEVGLDDDFDVVIYGTQLKEGLRILNNCEDYRDLIGQELKSGVIDNSLTFPFMMG